MATAHACRGQGLQGEVSKVHQACRPVPDDLQHCQPPHPQYNVELWRFPDRSTAIGSMINSYLTKQSEADDAAMHLLFSANRWEKR